MASGWEDYYVLGIAALLALAFPALLKLIGWLLQLRGRKKKPQLPRRALPAPANRQSVREKVNPRYYLAINVAVCLIVLGLALIPVSSALKSLETTGRFDLFQRGLLAVISLGSFLSLGLLYAARKGDLSWSDFFREKDS